MLAGHAEGSPCLTVCSEALCFELQPLHGVSECRQPMLVRLHRTISAGCPGSRRMHCAPLPRASPAPETRSLACSLDRHHQVTPSRNATHCGRSHSLPRICFVCRSSTCGLSSQTRPGWPSCRGCSRRAPQAGGFPEGCAPAFPCASASSTFPRIVAQTTSRGAIHCLPRRTRNTPAPVLFHVPVLPRLSPALSRRPPRGA